MKFSVITCTYNSAKYLQENIDSVEAQTYEDFEHIFIDGFSTDGTMAIIETYQQKHPDRVKVFQSEPRGISHAMNEGIKRSAGEYLIHLHSDDSFYDDHVLRKVDDFIKKNHEPLWLYGKARVVNVANKKTTIIPPRRYFYDKSRFWLLLLVSNYIPHQSVFIKKQIFEKYGYFDETLKNYMDLDLWLKLTQKNVHAKFINEIICNFSIREDAQSTIGRANTENVILYERYVKNRFVRKFLILFTTLYKFLLYKISLYKV
ncbi:MAG: glycosyltransferase family 2 protein [Parcubacteria group bacterium]|jgi:glycosyltransferase involved in cell wall biosynthesis